MVLIKKKGVRHSKGDLDAQTESETRASLCKTIADDVKGTKADLVTEESASSRQKLISSAAWGTFCLYLKNCADREGVTLRIHASDQ
jgi:hypothetical protein